MQGSRIFFYYLFYKIVTIKNDSLIKNGNLVRTLTCYSGNIWDVTFSPDNSKIISAGDDNDIGIWNAENGNLVRTLKGYKGCAMKVAFSQDNYKISESAGKTINR